MTGNGNFGEWITDEFGLPAYKYLCNQFEDPNAHYQTSYGSSIDHFHQIGNDRITATVHNGGYVQVLEAGRGFQWLTFKDDKKGSFGGGILLFSEKKSSELYSDIYSPEMLETLSYFDRIFGMGYFKKQIRYNKIDISHIVCTPFSDDPILISEIEIHNTSEEESIDTLNAINFWDINLHHLLRSLVVTHHNRTKFGKSKIINIVGNLLKFFQKISRTDTERSRSKFDEKFEYMTDMDFDKKIIYITPRMKRQPKIQKSFPAKHNYYPNTIFLAAINETNEFYVYEKSQIYKDGIFSLPPSNIEPIGQTSSKDPCLALGNQISLNPGEKKKLHYIFGYCEKSKIGNLIEKYQKIVEKESVTRWNAESWKKSIMTLKLQNKQWLDREIKWHSYYTRSSCVFDEYFNKHKFPQGSIYLFGHGLDGNIRDFMLFMPAICFITPNLAKEFLQYCIALMSPEGKLPYSTHGFANCFTGSVHSKPSDLQIFLIWGILQYIYLTRDFYFLEEQIEFYPKSLNLKSTVLERLVILLNCIFSDQIGLGSHGLIKVNDGDWSDGITLMARNRKKFIKRGESSFNSSFFLYVFLKLKPLLQEYMSDLVEEYEKKFVALHQSVLKAWNGKWFYRGYDGFGNPIGDKNIFLEHHNWLLISGLLDANKSASIIQNIYQKLDKPSTLGQYIAYPPQKTRFNILPSGWDVNGGVWHAMNALLTWAYSKYDIEKGVDSLIKNSLYQHANNFPDLWYGIWSAPDSYIADYDENAGEAFYHLPTPICDFPIMNLNAHATYLLGIIKIMGIEVFYDSIVIDTKIIDSDFAFISSLLSIESSKNSLQVILNYEIQSDFYLKIRKPKWWRDDSKLVMNGTPYKVSKSSNTLESKFLIIKIKRQKEPIIIELS